MPKDWLIVLSSCLPVRQAGFIVKKQFNSQKGFFHLGIIVAILFFIISVILFTYFKPFIKPNPKPTTSLNPKPTAVQTTSLPVTQNTPTPAAKKDLEALEKYCQEEALKLPRVPFTYKSKEGPTRSGPMPWVDQFIPKDKKESEKKACTMAYRYDGKTAYGQMGAKYPLGIDEFAKTLRKDLASRVGSSWEKMAGKNVSIDSFPMVYKKENPAMGTVDFIDAFDGGSIIYIKFNTYYK